MLMDHAKSVSDGIARTGKRTGAPLTRNHPFVRVVNPEEDVHQGRFSGAVFTEEGVDFALAHGEIHSIVGHHTGKALHDAEHLDRHPGVRHDRLISHRPPVPVHHAFSCRERPCP
ncbi:MAG: hypothetical protein R2843_05895 [Thermomicrobiales bacterium]